MTARGERQPPWERKRPVQRAKTLTAKERHEARSRARTAGRAYPNLVDNMAVIKKRKTARKAASRKTSRRSAKRR